MKYYITIYTVLIIAFSSLNLYAETKGKVRRLKSIDTANAYAPKALGLFIGIQQFSDPIWHQLKYPKKDVSDFVDFFTDNKTISLDYTMTLTNPENTTRDYILNHALDEFGMKNSSEEDVVFVYFSGHGTLTKEQVMVIEDGENKEIPRKRPYIVTSDTRAEKVADSALSLHKVTEWFDRLKSKRKVLILDMCHSGLGKSQISPDQAKQIHSAKGINFIPMEDSWASIILSACPMGGTSYEDEKLSNSVYTNFLLEGMKNGDLNGDGAITISEAHNYAIDKTRHYTFEHKGYKQLPTAYSKILGKDPIVVSGIPSETGVPVLFSYASVNQGVEVFVDKAYKGMLPKGMKVDPGKHMIECKIDGQVIFKGDIEFNSDFEYMLPDFTTTVKVKNTFIFLETGYRSYYRADVPKELVPDGGVLGVSIYHTGVIKEWLGISSGFDVAQNNDLDQFAFRAGIKLSPSTEKLRFFIGPDFMFLNFQYTSDKVGEIKVDEKMTFFCPGAEILMNFRPYRDMVISAGVRSYYIPYDLNSKSNTMFSGQAFLTMGYLF